MCLHLYCIFYGKKMATRLPVFCRKNNRFFFYSVCQHDKCDPGDTYCCRNYHRTGLDYSVSQWSVTVAQDQRVQHLSDIH